MAIKLRRGFKTDAERVAVAIREELGISPTSPLNCLDLCDQWGIPVISISELIDTGASQQSIRCLQSSNAKFSAMTIAAGMKRLIVYNPHHPEGRRANSLAHELSHILLEHPLSPALGAGGCRRWDDVLESEADWQAGTLLVPREAALAWMQFKGSIEDGARNYGVSLSLFRWRVHQTGVLKQLQARKNFYGRP